MKKLHPRTKLNRFTKKITKNIDSRATTTLFFTTCFLIGVGLSFLYTNFSQIKMNPKKKNSTLVFNSSRVAQNLKDECADTLRQQKKMAPDTCYARLFDQITKDYGYDKTVAVLLDLQKIDSGTFSSCHFIAHQIGSGVYKYDKANWRKIFAKFPSTCRDGILHGIIGEYLIDQPKNLKSDPKTYLNICDRSAPLNCYHAIGHVLYVENNKNIDMAISTCKLFPSHEKSNSCLKGTFMENVIPIMSIQHGLADRSAFNYSVRLPELTNTCNSNETDADVYFQCWGELSKAILSTNHFDPQKTFEYCNTASDNNASEQCIRRSIQDIIAGNPENLNNAKKICDIPQEQHRNFKTMCYKELGATAAQILPDWKKFIVIDYCMSLAIDFKKTCIVQLGNELKRDLGTEKIKSICKQAKSPYDKYCIDGSKNT